MKKTKRIRNSVIKSVQPINKVVVAGQIDKPNVVMEITYSLEEIPRAEITDDQVNF